MTTEFRIDLSMTFRITLFLLLSTFFLACGGVKRAEKVHVGDGDGADLDGLRCFLGGAFSVSGHGYQLRLGYKPCSAMM